MQTSGTAATQLADEADRPVRDDGANGLGFDAFFSYSHRTDRALAAELQRAVQRVGKSWWQRRRLRVCRDESTLALTPALWSSVEASLADSRFLVLLASEAAATSEWVRKEVGWWLANKSADTLLIVHTDGALCWDAQNWGFDSTRTSALPRELHDQFVEEPKFLDLRWAHEDAVRGGARTARLLDAAAEISAAIQGIAKDELVGEDLRAQRRAKALARSAVAILLVLLVTAIWQAVVAREQAEIARRQAEIAERRFEDVRGLSNRVLNEFHPQIADLPGATDARIWLVNTAFEYLGKLRRDAESDQRLLLDIARGYERQGHFLGDPYFASLGQTESALDAYREALAIHAQLPAELGETPDVRRQEVWVRSGVGVLLAMQGKTKEAEPYFQDAIREMAAIVALGPPIAGKEDSKNLALLHHRYGDSFLHHGNQEAAQREFDAARGITTVLFELNRDDAVIARFHAQILGKLAAVAFDDDPQRSASLFDEERQILEPIAAKEPNNVSVVSDLALTLFSLATLKATSLDDAPGAAKLYDEVLRHRKRLVESDRRNGNAHRDLVQEARVAGTFFLHNGDKEKGAELLGLAITSGQERLALAPGDAVAAQDLAETYRLVGDVAMQERELTAAAAAYTGLVELAAAGPEWPQERWHILAHALHGAAYASLVTTGTSEKVAKDLGRAEEMLRRRLEEAPRDAVAMQELSHVLGIRAQVAYAIAEKSRTAEAEIQALRSTCDYQRSALHLSREAAKIDAETVPSASLTALADLVRSCDELVSASAPRSRRR